MLIGIILAIIASAFFSGMEIAFISCSKLRFEIDKDKNSLVGSIMDIFQKHPENFISTMLVGNNIALIVYGILMADLLEPVFLNIYNNELFVFLSQTLCSTLLILITAEFLPKNVFQLNPNGFLRFFALPLLPIYFILFPISKSVSFLSKMTLRLFNIRGIGNSHEYHFSKIDLDYFVQQGISNSVDEDEIDPEVKIFQNALYFRNVKLRDCIIPRTEIIAVDYNTPLAELVSLFIETGKSKILVYKDSIDNIVGYFHVSEVFKDHDDWHTAIKPIQIVPETMPANKLMKLLMDNKQSLSAVVDEFGGTSGIVTLEDLVEEFLGEIEDEHDVHNLTAKKNDDGSYVLSGRLEVDRANELFDLNIPESEDYLTIAGFILHSSQHLPTLNETIKVDRYNFKIVKVTTTKIELVTLLIDD